MTVFMAMPAWWTDIPLLLMSAALIWIFWDPISYLCFRSWFFVAGWRLARDLDKSLHADTYFLRDNARAAHEWFWGK